MDLRIEQACELGRVIWLVHACGLTFKFLDQSSALAFARKLEERVDAPHPLPIETVERWAAEHARLLHDP